MFSFLKNIFTHLLCLSFMLGTSFCVFAGQGNWPPPPSTLMPAYAPKVDIGPNSNGKAVLLQVGNKEGDQSTMWRSIPIHDYTSLTVSFDIYRYNTDYGQNLWWWVGNSPDSIPGNPAFGLQWDGGYQNPNYRTYPAGFSFASTPTIFGAYANISMTWDFIHSTFSSTYNGGTVFNNVSFSPFINRNDFSGFGIQLLHDTPTGVGGPSRVWIDNLKISDDLIYDSLGFENFSVGNLNNQENWVAAGAFVPDKCYLPYIMRSQ
jgi:hypothetical protein